MGTTTERQLVTALDSLGYAAVRAPASGAATDRDLPDVLAGTRTPVPGRGTFADCLAIEEKTTKRTTAYVDPGEVDDLEAFAHAFGADARLAVKFKRPGGGRSAIWLVPPDAARMTDSGRYGLPEADIGARADMAIYPETNAKDARLERL